MSLRFYTSPKYFSDQSLSSDLNGSTIDLGTMSHISANAFITSAASPNGVLKLQLSNDNQNWLDSSATATVSGNGSARLALTQLGERYVRLVYQWSSGSATLNASIHCK